MITCETRFLNTLYARKSASIDCTLRVSLEEHPLGSRSLAYDATTMTYTHVWKTEKAWANTCRELQVKLTDGSVHKALFQFGK